MVSVKAELRDEGQRFGADEVKQGDETRQEDSRDQHHDGGIHDSLYFLKPFIFGSDSQGQLALRSSPFTSPKKRVTFANMPDLPERESVEVKMSEMARGWDSNPQPTVLETATLPIELLPC